MIESRLHRTRLTLGAITVLLTLSACGGNDPAAAPSATTPAAAEPTTMAVTPTQGSASATPTKQAGQIGDPAMETAEGTHANMPKRRPLAVMIENHPKSRPQSGLHKAEVVYEAPAEYGIPRFLAIYVNQDAKVLGPVRSARTYFVALANEYDPVYVHAGGSPQSLGQLKKGEMKHIDALRYAGGGFERTSDRVAPHNLYTDTAELRKVIARDPELKGGKGTWGGLEFSDSPTVGKEEGLEVTVEYEGGYSVTYYYDERSGQYKREMVGEPHLDRESKKQLTGSAIIVQTVRMFKVKGDKYGRMEMQLRGKGPVLIFQDSRVTKGFWEKTERESPAKYTTEDGQPVKLKKGQVWIQMVPRDGTKVDY